MVARTWLSTAAGMLVLLSGCAHPPASPPTAPSQPVPAALPPPPNNPTTVQCSDAGSGSAPVKAVASVTVQDSLGALWGLAWLTPIVFDGSGSTGTNLTFHWAMSDGVTSDDPVVTTTFPGAFDEQVVAKLTVSSADGHQSSTTCRTAVTDLSLETGHWTQKPFPGGKVANALVLVLHTTADAPRTIGGGYFLGSTPGVPRSPGAGAITGERDFYFAAQDGSFELIGQFHLHDSVAPDYNLIRALVRGGPLDGQTIDFYADEGF